MFYMLQVNLDDTVSGVYAMEASIHRDTWHLLAVTYNSLAGDFEFMVDDLVETKHHDMWTGLTHVTSTNIRIGESKHEGHMHSGYAR